MFKEIWHSIFDKVISLENLFSAWREFKRGKRKKNDVREFEFGLEDNLFELHNSLKTCVYRHSAYESFYIADPKLRHIHKAIVRDRVVHQAIFRVLYPIFDSGFIHDSYSCRTRKGTHRAVQQLQIFARRASRNFKVPVFALKCDIRKFFDSINHDVLISLIKRHVYDKRALFLICTIIESFETTSRTGLPLGNVTSQLFANIYLNEFDQFMKRVLKEKCYIRYCDDFIVLDTSVSHLHSLIPPIEKFLRENLKLFLHSEKVTVCKFSQGVDFLGYVSFPHYSVLRTKTKRRIFRKLLEKHRQFMNGIISSDSFFQTFQSYCGVLKHCRGFKIRKRLEKLIS